jgi:PAS domain S-box-containing protein
MNTLVIESNPVTGRPSVTGTAVRTEAPPPSALETRLRLIVETAPVGLMVLSRQGQVHAANQAALAILGAQRLEDVRGHNVALLVADDHRQRFTDFVARVCDGESDSLDYEVPVADKGPRRVTTRAVRLRRDDGTSAFLGATWELTAPDQATGQPDLKAQCEALEDTLRELTDGYDALAREKSAIETSLAEARTQLERGGATTEQQQAQRASEWEAERSALQAQLGDADEKQRGLAQRLERYSQEAATWEAERGALQAQVRDAGEKQRELAERLEQHSQDASGWETERGALQVQLRDADEKQRDLAQRLERHSEEAGAWESERGALQAQLREAGEKHRELAERLERHSEQASGWDTERAALQAQLGDADGKQRKLAERLERHSQEAAAWEAERGALQAQLRDAEVEQRERTQQDERHAQQAAAWEAERGSLQAQLRDADGKHSELGQQIERHSQQAAGWEAERGALQEQLRDADGKHRDLAQRLERVEAETETTSTQLRQQVEAALQLTSDLDSLRRRHEELLADLCAERERSQALIDDRDRRQAELTTVLEALRTTTGQLSAVLIGGGSPDPDGAAAEGAGVPEGATAEVTSTSSVEPWAF